MKSFLIAIKKTLGHFFNDGGILLVVLLAPVMYGFYYPLPYKDQLVRHIPVAIVDHAQDSLSRKMIRMVSATPNIVIDVVPNEKEAKDKLLKNEVIAFMVIPSNLYKNSLKAESNTINIIGNGGYILPAKTALKSISDVVLSLSKEIEIKQLMPFVKNKQQVTAIQDPVPLQIQTLYNQNEGYGSYVVPAVAWLILQQTLLIGCAMLVGTWWEKKNAYASKTVWLGRITAMTLVHYVICFGYTAIMFKSWGYASGLNMQGNLLLISLFSPSVVILGYILGLLIKDRERSMQLLIFSSLPMYFIVGFSWPVELLPTILQYLRWVFPSTSAILAGVSFNQIGGSILDNWYYLATLAIIIVCGINLLFYLGRENKLYTKIKE